MAADEGYEPDRFPRFAVTVDIAVVAVTDAKLVVLLGRRAEEPFRGRWALPGGFKRPDESLDDAAQRVLGEEIDAFAAIESGGLAPGGLRQFGAYGDPERDPRTNVVTVGYLATVPVAPPTTAGARTSEVMWFNVDDVAAERVEMAFDHRQIVLDAAQRVAADLDRTDVALTLVGSEFSLTALQEVFEAAWGTAFDPANFRRSVTADRDAPFVVDTGKRGRSGPRGGQPARLYRPGPAWNLGPPVRRRH